MDMSVVARPQATRVEAMTAALYLARIQSLVFVGANMIYTARYQQEAEDVRGVYVPLRVDGRVNVEGQPENGQW